ncbi:MAG: hypothetical protein KC561_17345 [Myxococcales bacterium]|nr:hypothetical protein [Myxococcales bacterium]
MESHKANQPTASRNQESPPEPTRPKAWFWAFLAVATVALIALLALNRRLQTDDIPLPVVPEAFSLAQAPQPSDYPLPEPVQITFDWPNPTRLQTEVVVEVSQHVDDLGTFSASGRVQGDIVAARDGANYMISFENILVSEIQGDAQVQSYLTPQLQAITSQSPFLIDAQGQFAGDPSDRAIGTWESWVGRAIATQESGGYECVSADLPTLIGSGLRTTSCSGMTGRVACANGEGTGCAELITVNSYDGRQLSELAAQQSPGTTFSEWVQSDVTRTRIRLADAIPVRIETWGTSDYVMEPFGAGRVPVQTVVHYSTTFQIP